MNESIGLIVPTHGKLSWLSPLPYADVLRRNLGSVVPQLKHGDEVLVVGDVTDGPLPHTEAICKEFGPRVRYLPLEGTTEHSWGHDQVGYGLKMADTAWLHVNDHDDVWVPDALPTFRRAIAEYGPTAMLFRFESYYARQVFWLERGLYGRNRISGHCLLQPNVTGKLGLPRPPYNGDFDMVDGAVQAWGGPDTVPWIDHIVAIARP